MYYLGWLWVCQSKVFVADLRCADSSSIQLLALCLRFWDLGGTLHGRVYLRFRRSGVLVRP